ncbi:A/G-specific adenine glycosylase [Sphingobacterium daejeonense]|uniref:A/G-specific adenine glycosylase n=1 Tax=Sphingobacterium daejeonense TaxID=371142 RepID=UPI0021A93456|nr:A/G-specific adenine glycosylase [Sphingobacterium daejeonense]MCT1531638.1 A/G-specific adenine glycosylase [Sphingobacterium daejeonense]
MSFSERILAWYSTHKRALPWRETKNPYVIWLSEIILQQTRVEQGMPYFLRFVENYPNVTKFANADEADILRLWQGLGYYSRARNMHKASKQVIDLHKGVFPVDYHDLLKLPGVGEYTAAAISSFANNQPYAVLDGNVFRVLARYFGIHEPINSTAGKKIFANLAEEMLDLNHPAEYNQAIMDFGSMQCKPKNPNCEECILRLDCVAYQDNLVDQLPQKIKAKKSRDRFFHYFIIQKEDSVLMSQRTEGDVWANLFEFPMIETTTDLNVAELVQMKEYQEAFGNIQPIQIKGQIKHILSHQNIFAKFYTLNIDNMELGKKSHWNYCLLENLDKLAKHKLISSFVEHYF